MGGTLDVNSLKDMYHVVDGRAYGAFIEDIKTPEKLIEAHPPSVWRRHPQYGQEGWSEAELTEKLGKKIGQAEAAEIVKAAKDAESIPKANAKWWHKLILNEKGINAALAGDEFKMMEHVHPLKAVGWAAIPAGIAYLTMGGKQQQPDALITNAQLESQRDQAHEQGPALY